MMIRCTDTAIAITTIRTGGRTNTIGATPPSAVMVLMVVTVLVGIEYCIIVVVALESERAE